MVEAIIFWWPIYRISAATKVATAIASWAAVIGLIKVTPEALKLPGLAAVNKQLKEEIAERKRYAEALKTSEERLRLLIDTITSIVWNAGPNGDFLEPQPEWGQYTGQSWEEHKGLGWTQALHPDDRETIQAAWQQAVENRSTYHAEGRMWSQQHQEYRYFTAAATPRMDDEGRIIEWIGTNTDIHERKLAEEERIRFEQSLQQTQKMESLGILAGGIAHDFNNILMGVLGNAGLLLTTMKKDSPHREIVKQIEYSAQRAADLTNQLLAYSGKGKFVISSINLSELVSELVNLLKIPISKKIILFLNLQENMPTFNGDATQIRQVMMNLITNASEAIGDQEGTISITTGALNCDREYLQWLFNEENLSPGLYVYLEVSDTGCGMDQDTLNRLFDPFFTTKFIGRGLGLSAVIGIIRDHSGGIRVYSEVGKGTTFKVFFPAESEH